MSVKNKTFKKYCCFKLKWVFKDGDYYIKSKKEVLPFCLPLTLTVLLMVTLMLGSMFHLLVLPYSLSDIISMTHSI